MLIFASIRLGNHFNMNNQCLICDGKGWYAHMNCSSFPWEAEQIPCVTCSGSGRITDEQKEEILDQIHSQCMDDAFGSHGQG